MPIKTMGKLEQAKTGPLVVVAVLAGVLVVGAAGGYAQPTEPASHPATAATAAVTKTPVPVTNLPRTGGTTSGPSHSAIFNELGIALGIGLLMLGLITRPTRRRRNS